MNAQGSNAGRDMRIISKGAQTRGHGQNKKRSNSSICTYSMEINGCIFQIKLNSMAIFEQGTMSKIISCPSSKEPSRILIQPYSQQSKPTIVLYLFPLFLNCFEFRQKLGIEIVSKKERNLRSVNVSMPRIQKLRVASFCTDKKFLKTSKQRRQNSYMKK